MPDALAPPATPFGPARSHTARTEANSRLTAAAGLVLFVLLGALGVTILRIHRLLTAHVVIGLVLLGPLAVKLASVGVRFFRYYSGDVEYGAAGPPRPLLRALAPLLLITTIVVFASGIALLAVRPGRASTIVLVHKASFVVWFAVTTIHVLAYILPALRWTVADVLGRGSDRVVASRGNRGLLLLAGLAAGCLLGAAGPGWAHAWVTWFATGRGGDR